MLVHKGFMLSALMLCLPFAPVAGYGTVDRSALQPTAESPVKESVGPTVSVQDDKARFGVRADRGYLVSNGNLTVGSTLIFNVIDKTTNTVQETIKVPITSDNAGEYSWPHALATAINAGSVYARAGEWKNNKYVPAWSSYLNTVWLPSDLSLSFTYYIDNPKKIQHSQILKQLTDATVNNPLPAAIPAWLSQEKAGAFVDLVYPDNRYPISDTTVTGEHLNRMLSLASYAYQHRAECQKNNDCALIEKAQAASVRAMQFFIEKKYRFSNWWHSSIGNPRYVTRTALLALPEITPNQMVQILLPYMKVANVANGVNNWGANLMDYAAIQQMWSALALNGGIASASDMTLYENTLRESMKTASDLVIIQDGKDADSCEGIRVDMSFTSHCGTADGQTISQLYTAGYGQVFMSSLLALQGGVLGTEYVLSPEKIELLEQWLIEGTGWSGYAGMTDFHVMGRSHSRQTSGFGGQVNSFTAQFLKMNPNGPRADTLRELQYRGKTGDESRNDYYLGNRYYWTTDNMFHFGPAFSSSLRMVSKRTTTSETGNGEGLLSYFLGAGSQLITRTGKEYWDIQPVWNWKRLPGTTAEQDALKLPLNEWGNTAYGSHRFVGGVSDGISGLAAMELTRLNVKEARKSYFHFGDALLNMGSNIDMTQAKAEVVTSVEQSLRRGAVFYKFRGDNAVHSLESGQAVDSAMIEWVQHNGIEYVFPAVETRTVTLQSKIQTGSWRVINQGGSASEISKEVFSLWITHSKGSRGGYQYYVQPASSFDGLATDYGAKDRADNLLTHSDNDLHTVYDRQSKVGMAAVYAVNPQWISLTPELQFMPDVPVLVMAKASDTPGEIDLTLSEPTQNALLKYAVLKIKGQFTCVKNCTSEPSADGGATSVSIALPGGMEAGKSVSFTLN